VTCVLVAVLLTAAFSLELSLAEYAEDQPIPDKLDLGSLNLGSLDLGRLGERLNAKTIAIVFGNPKASSLTVAHDLSDAADAGGHSRILPLVDKDGVARRVSGRAGERGEARSATLGVSQSAGG
jgi:hypothetical protein